MKNGMIRASVLLFAWCVGVTAAAAQGAMTKEQVERRYNVRVFGNVLVSAAQHGAELMAFRVQQIDPSIILLSGTAPRAQGFVIDGHGVFFHIEIPNVDPVVAWAVTNRGRDQVAIAALNRWKAILPTLTDPAQRSALEADIRDLERRFMPPGAQQQQQQRMGVIPMGTAPSAPAAPPPVMNNPNMEYERLVTDQLVNAMLDYGHQLGLGADEWLTIAARSSQGAIVAEAVFDDSVTIMLRIKGSDLAAFRAGQLTRDEARARVVVREF